MNTTLTLAQFILACSLSQEPRVEDMLYRVVMATSQGHPHWMLTHEGHIYTPENKARAEHTLSGLLKAPGARVHVGVAALSSLRLKDHTREPERALDACTNLKIASLELEGVLPSTKKRKHVQALHEALAMYYDPGHPEGLAALSFGARVLAIDAIDVRKEAVSESPEPGPTFELNRSLFYDEGTPEQPTPSVPPTPPESQPAQAPREPEHKEEP